MDNGYCRGDKLVSKGKPPQKLCKFWTINLPCACHFTYTESQSRFRLHLSCFVWQIWSCNLVKNSDPIKASLWNHIDCPLQILRRKKHRKWYTWLANMKKKNASREWNCPHDYHVTIYPTSPCPARSTVGSMIDHVIISWKLLCPPSSRVYQIILSVNIVPTTIKLVLWCFFFSVLLIQLYCIYF